MNDRFAASMVIVAAFAGGVAERAMIFVGFGGGFCGFWVDRGKF
jgi:hypothetical protein